MRSKQTDGDTYLFAITENTNDVAMMLIDESDQVHINAAARALLMKLWRGNYRRNLQHLIPDMAGQLDRGHLYMAGVKLSDEEGTKAMEIRERWINLLQMAATGTKKTRTLLTPIGLLIFGVFTGLFVLAAVVVDRVLALPRLVPESARLSISIPVLAVGVFVTAWSVFHFLKVKGTPVPFNPPPQVVSTGPYRYVRNPMLTGVFLFLFGLGLGLNSGSLVLFFTPLYVVLNVWELKHIEEPELIKRLGDEYLEYRKKTPMFFPRRRPRPIS